MPAHTTRPRGAAAALAPFCAVLLAYAPPSHAGDPGPIPWRSDPREAQAEARRSDRPVWVQFTGPWCPNCRRLERGAFHDARVVTLALDRFVPVTLRSDQYEQFALDFGLSNLPATVILKPTGEVIAMREGYIDADGFAAFLLDALVRDGRPVVDLAKAAADKGDGLVLAGYDPVSLVADRKLVAGSPDLSARYDGMEFRFATPDGRESFRREPEKFIPLNRGRCPVSQVDRGDVRAGDPRWGVVYHGHLYVFADETHRSDFVKSPRRYADVDVADRGFCPHCWTKQRLLVRGEPRYSLAAGGRRFWFPDSSHLDAFLALAPTTRR